MEGLFGYVVGLIPTAAILILLVVHYERQLKYSRQERDNLQKQNNSLLSAVMAVDYEKLREVEIRAAADAQIAWSKATLTDEWQMIQEPTEVEIPHAHGTR